MVFTDIVGSTLKASELGDRQWRYLLEAHNAEVRKLIARFRGDEVERVGDGFLITFDGPARAIRCACACVDAVSQLGLQLRIGIHTGELERRAKTLAGVALHVGARVAALAAPSQVLVTGVVKTLVLGSGIEFEAVGTHNLKGVPGSWELFAVAR
jgi:class 3 adenylate cyclase